MKSFRPSVFVVLLACMAISGCAMLGVAIHYPMIQVQNDTAAVPAGADLGDAILRAASARRWIATVTTPGVIRCRFDSRSWNMEVDVRYSGSTFSIDYVSSEGLFYRPEMGDIHNTYNRQVEALRQRIKQEAMRLPPPAVSYAQTTVATPGTTPAVVAAPAKPYTIESFSRETGNGFAYRFVLALTDASSADLALSRRIQADLRESVRADYAAATGVKDISSLRIEFPQYALANGKVEGLAVVMSVQLQEFVYDPVTKQGRLAVKVNPQQYEITRQWVRNNIATLARDKDPSLLNVFTGRSNFTIGREVLQDNNVLEVEFKMGNSQ